MVLSPQFSVPQDTPATVKRPRADSELVMPHTKRTKRALNDGHDPDTCISSVSCGQDIGSNHSGQKQELSNLWSSYTSGKVASVSTSSESPAVPSDDAVLKDNLSNECDHVAPCHFKRILAIGYVHLQTRIIEQIVPQDRLITPSYKLGMLRAYIVSDSDGRPDTASDEELALTVVMGDSNRHLSIPFVNRALDKVYRSLFYSRNTFAFDDPRAALWFFKCIRANFDSIRSVKFTIDGGLERYRRNSAISESIEELWYSVLCWLQYKHQIDDLTMIFSDMPTRRELNLVVDLGDEHMADDAMTFRKKIAQKLNTFRGITKVKLLDHRNAFMRDYELRDLQLAMQQPKEEQETIVDKRKTSLLDTLNSCRTRNELAASITPSSEEFEDLFDYNRVEDQHVEFPRGVIDMEESDSTSGVEIFDADTKTFNEVDTMIHDDAAAFVHSTSAPPSASSTLLPLSKNRIRLLKRKEKKSRQMKEKESKDITPKVLAPVIINRVANSSKGPSKDEVVPSRHVRERLTPTEPTVQPGMSSIISNAAPTASEYASHTAEPSVSETSALETRMPKLLQPTTVTNVTRNAGYSQTVYRASTLKSEVSPHSFYGNPVSRPNNLYSSQPSHGLAVVAHTKPRSSNADSNTSASTHSTVSAHGGIRNRQQGHYGRKKHNLAKYDF